MGIGQQLIELLGENGERWCQDHLAVDKHGTGKYPNYSTAVKWCVAGACIRLDIPGDVTLKLRQFVGGSWTAFNDEHSWSYVKAKLLEFDKCQSGNS